MEPHGEPPREKNIRTPITLAFMLCEKAQFQVKMAIRVLTYRMQNSDRNCASIRCKRVRQAKKIALQENETALS